MKQNNLKIIGLTGNSGSGKSTVSKILKKYNVYVIDADKISRNVFEIGEDAYYEVIKNFGEVIVLPDKNINRKKLGDIVFESKEKLNLLTKITHRYIIQRIISEAEEKRKLEYNFILIDAPLIIGTKLETYVEEIWLVYAGYNKCMERIIKRDNLTTAKAEKRLNNQLNYKAISNRFDVCIENNSDDLNILEHKIKSILKTKGFLGGENV